MSELRIRLEGQCAELGKVPARDVAKLLIGVELAVMRAASVVLGRPKKATGRGEGIVERAARFRLRAIDPGSVVPVLELPEAAAEGEYTLDLAEAATLAEDALERVLRVAEGSEREPLITSAVLELSDALGIGERYEKVTFEYRTPRRSAPQVVCVDGTARARLRQQVDEEAVAVRQDTVSGVLVEADFESHTARLRGPFNQAVTVSFGEDLEDDIQEALRQQATFRGQVAYDPKTLAAKTVRLEQITRGRQLILGIDPDAFWIERSIDELARAQGVAPIATLDELTNTEATDEERDAFMAALASLNG